MLSWAIGIGLSDAFFAAAAVTRGRGRQRRSAELVTEFVQALGASLGPDDRELVVDLDELAPALRDSCERVRTAEERTEWAFHVAGELLTATEPLFTRQLPVTPDGAAFIRLAALALAAEPNGVAREEFHMIAAGVTLLQRRATDAPGGEGVILARE